MKSQSFISSFLLLICIFELTGCSTFLSGIYGMKKVKTVDEETILHYSQKYNIPVADIYTLDTSFISLLASFDTTLYKQQIKNHFQPLQALYFNKTRQLQSFQINCYAGGFPNLHWDRNNIMTTFPPGQQAPLDSILSFNTQIKYLLPFSSTKTIEADDYYFIVIVYWNRFMGRQSKRLIRFVQVNSKLAGDKKVKIIYVNNDNLFARPLRSSNM